MSESPNSEPLPEGTRVRIRRRNGNRASIVLMGTIIGHRRCAGRIDYQIESAPGAEPWWTQAKMCDEANGGAA